MALPDNARRLLAAGSRALALENDWRTYETLGSETRRWLERRQVTLHLRPRSHPVVRQILAMLESGDCAPRDPAIEETKEGLTLTIVAPWSLVALLVVTFTDELRALSFSTEETRPTALR